MSWTFTLSLHGIIAAVQCALGGLVFAIGLVIALSEGEVLPFLIGAAVLALTITTAFLLVL